MKVPDTTRTREGKKKKQRRTKRERKQRRLPYTISHHDTAALIDIIFSNRLNQK